MHRARVDVEDVRAAAERVLAVGFRDRDAHLANGHPPRYVVGGTPSCLAAVVMAELGVSVQALRRLDRAEAKTPIELSDSRDPLLR
ncbi:hypothetical protein [Nocardia sp. NPDC050710]|uniref:hypothetical protein n=1 Tax=Nocardia sp. NPDC050710 TaxID=3157220 RepID=UPI0033FE676B